MFVSILFEAVQRALHAAVAELQHVEVQLFCSEERGDREKLEKTSPYKVGGFSVSRFFVR